MNQPWVFRWLSLRQYILVSILYEILIFFFIHCHRGSGDIMVSARLDDYPNIVGRCITVWNLSAGGVVTGPTSRSCIACLRVTVSSILSVGLWTRIRVLTQHGTHALVLDSKYGGLSWHDWYMNDSRSSYLNVYQCIFGQSYLSFQRFFK